MEKEKVRQREMYQVTYRNEERGRDNEIRI
jgi:hypothetical protein